MSATESPNEAMYRRIENRTRIENRKRVPSRERGPSLLIALSDGQQWNTRELSKRYAQQSVMHKRNATYSVLWHYARRGFVRHAGHVFLRHDSRGQRYRVSLWQITPEGMAIVRGAK